MDKNTTLLDMGCGNGYYTYYFDKICNVIGIDISSDMINQNPVKNTYIMNAEHMYFSDDEFDIVFCNSLLHHVKDESIVIQEMIRISNKYVIICEPNRNNPIMFLITLFMKSERQALKYSLSYLKKFVKNHNLKIIDSYSTSMILPNVTPSYLLPILNLFNIKFFFGMKNVIICQKKLEQ